MSSDRTARGREIENSTAARLAEIVAAAEQAARQVIDEAEAEARERLSDAHEEADRIVAERLAGLAELTDQIGAQAEALRRQAEALQRALAEAKAELGGGAEGAEAPGDSPRAMGRRASDPDPEAEAAKPEGPALTVVGSPKQDEPARAEAPMSPSDAESEADLGRRGEPGTGATRDDGEPATFGTPAGARLLATQMAVSGSSREEIETRLRNGFAIADTRAILDAILGPEQ